MNMKHICKAVLATVILMMFWCGGLVFAEGSDQYTKLMIHADSTNGSTSFIDSSDSNHSIIANGNAQHSTSQAKFGGSSMYFHGGYLSIPDSDDWTFGSGDFTIDFWVNFSDTSNSQCIVSQTDTGVYNTWSIMKQPPSDGNIITAYFGLGISPYEVKMTNNWNLNINQWYHIAIVLNGGTPFIYIDGVSQSITIRQSNISAIGNNISGNLTLGAYFYNSYYGWYLNGYLDELRISKGIARWTSDFFNELPTLPYSTLPKMFYVGGEGDGRMIINPTGNVGIGTVTPDSKLTVNGAIKAKKVVVTLDGWADFVFDDAYALPPLSDVDDYIKTNKRLPGIPSAEQMVTDGLSLSDMMTSHMQKIEELTLYMIELQKENVRLKTELKKENTSLKERVKALESGTGK